MRLGNRKLKSAMKKVKFITGGLDLPELVYANKADLQKRLGIMLRDIQRLQTEQYYLRFRFKEVISQLEEIRSRSISTRIKTWYKNLLYKYWRNY